jgi:hypothetical protein
VFRRVIVALAHVVVENEIVKHFAHFNRFLRPGGAIEDQHKFFDLENILRLNFFAFLK